MDAWTFQSVTSWTPGLVFSLILEHLDLNPVCPMGTKKLRQFRVSGESNVDMRGQSEYQEKPTCGWGEHVNLRQKASRLGLFLLRGNGSNQSSTAGSCWEWSPTQTMSSNWTEHVLLNYDLRKVCIPSHLFVCNSANRNHFSHQFLWSPRASGVKGPTISAAVFFCFYCCSQAQAENQEPKLSCGAEECHLNHFVVIGFLFQWQRFF